MHHNKEKNISFQKMYMFNASSHGLLNFNSNSDNIYKHITISVLVNFV